MPAPVSQQFITPYAAIDNGYSMQQISDTAFTGDFTGNALLLDDAGTSIVPAYKPSVLIVDDTVKRVTTRATESQAFPRKELEVSVDRLISSLQEVVDDELSPYVKGFLVPFFSDL
ncbi:MAG: hypothetical protein KZQ83_20775 [gamma proteobacterium symbiont of Taylorina sp.]|nr:hypothetical protein [gamma proteobacterium symbiont of Taylorina sp.]